MQVRPTSGKGTRDQGGVIDQRGGRTPSRHKPHVGDGTRVWANHGRRGVCESALKPRQAGKVHRRNATVPNRTWENRPSGIIGGPRETQPWWNCEPALQPKGQGR